MDDFIPFELYTLTPLLVNSKIFLGLTRLLAALKKKSEKVKPTHAVTSTLVIFKLIVITS